MTDELFSLRGKRYMLTVFICLTRKNTRLAAQFVLLLQYRKHLRYMPEWKLMGAEIRRKKDMSL